MDNMLYALYTYKHHPTYILLYNITRMDNMLYVLYTYKHHLT